MIFSRFKKPRWQHRNPTVRKEAIAALGTDDRETLAQIARADEDPALRRLALNKLNDLPAIKAMAAGDSDSDVRAAALHRFRQLLTGVEDDSPPLPARRQALDSIDDMESIEAVALDGREPELRRAALARVERVSVLVEAALRDGDIDNRLACVDRIDRAASLEQLVKRARNRDKRVTRRARERLAILSAEATGPRDLAASRERVCKEMEALGSHGGGSENAPDAIQRLDQEWEAADGEDDPELGPRFAAARRRLLEKYESELRLREEEDRQLVAVRELGQAAVSDLDGILSALQDLESVGPDDHRRCQQEFDEVQSRWAQLGDLPEPERQTLERRYQRRRDAVADQLAKLDRLLKAESDCEKLCMKARRLLEREGSLDPKDVKAWERKSPSNQETSGSGRLQGLCRQLNELQLSLHERLHKEREEREHLLEAMPGWLSQIDQALREGKLREAGPLYDRAADGLRKLREQGVSGERLAEAEEGLKALTPRVQELRRWRHWATDEARERLCLEMEKLVISDQAPEETARQIHRLQEQWKRVQSSGDQGGRSLWERFQSASHKAYEPCRVHFEQQAAQRLANLEKKRELCERLESFLADADWSHVDWKAVMRQRRQIHKAWHDADPIDRKEKAAIGKRFHAAMSVLDDHLDYERERNLKQRRDLIQRILALGNLRDTDQAVQECKRLQHEWVTTVTAGRSEENRLWAEFRQACDTVFARRHEAAEEQHKEIGENLARKRAIVQAMADLVSTTEVDPDHLQRELHRWQSEWDETGPVPRRDQRGLDERFQALRGDLEQRVHALERAARLDRMHQLARKAALCEAVEGLLGEAGTESAPQEVEELRARWDELPPLRNPETEKAITARFAEACRAVSGAEGLSAILETQGGNLTRRKELCLRMEVLADTDSPPECADERMQVQVARLARAMTGQRESGDEEAWAIERAWYLTGPAPVDYAGQLSTRFEQARTGYWSRARRLPGVSGIDRGSDGRDTPTS